MNPWVPFGNCPEEVRSMAVFVATLVKEGVTFTIKKDAAGYEVHLTGGY